MILTYKDVNCDRLSHGVTCRYENEQEREEKFKCYEILVFFKYNFMKII